MSTMIKDAESLGRILRPGTKLLLKVGVFKDPILMTYIKFDRGYEFERRDTTDGAEWSAYKSFNSLEEIYDSMVNYINNESSTYKLKDITFENVSDVNLSIDDNDKAKRTFTFIHNGLTYKREWDNHWCHACYDVYVNDQLVRTYILIIDFVHRIYKEYRKSLTHKPELEPEYNFQQLISDGFRDAAMKSKK